MTADREPERSNVWFSPLSNDTLILGLKDPEDESLQAVASFRLQLFFKVVLTNTNIP